MSVAKSRALVQSAIPPGGSVPSHSRGEFYHEGVDSGYKFVSDSLQSLCRLCLRSVARSVQSESAPYAAIEMAAPPSRLGGKLLGLPVNSGRIRKHMKTITCKFTGGACGESYRSRPLARGSWIDPQECLIHQGRGGTPLEAYFRRDTDECPRAG